MTFAELDKLPVAEPLNGIELKKYCTNRQEMREWLRELLSLRALVCTSPGRCKRCDNPATGMFWQDDCEWYPCCDAHWPGQQQWLGSTRFHPGMIRALCFVERVPGRPGELYDRTNAA